MTAARQNVETHTAVSSGGHIEFRLVRMPRRRHAHLFVDVERGVEVRASSRFSASEARSFVAANSVWVRSRLDELRRARPPLVSGTRLPFLDDSLVLRVRLANAQLSLLDDGPEPRSTPAAGMAQHRSRPDAVVRREGRSLVVDSGRASAEAVREGVLRWYHEAAQTYLVERVELLAEQVGLRPSRVRVKHQRSMWGSCSVSHEIALNWRLVLVPELLADYVIVHELCHIAHHDHSSRFWARVAQTVPDHADRRAQLRALQDCLAL